jgi:hypothetical protein
LSICLLFVWLQILVDNFALKPADTTNPELDLQKMMQRA